MSGTTAATSNNNFQWLPDISIQIILSKDKKLRAIVFNRSSLATTANTIGSGTIGRVTKQGVSISYTKDFDKFFGGTQDIYFTPPKQKDSLSAPHKTKK